VHKISVVILSLTILLQSFSIDAADFNKISTLVDHITCHFESGDGFSDFISMHYGSTIKAHKNTHKEHKELPFKHEHLDAHFQLDYIFNDTNIAENFEENNFSDKNFSFKEPSTGSYINNLFQPPQK